MFRPSFKSLPAGESQGERVRWQVQAFGWFGLAVMAALTLFFWRYSTEDLARREASRFDQLADRQASALADRMHDYERVLRGVAGLFGASGNVSREEFRGYVDALNLEGSLPGIQGTGFAKLIPAGDLEAHVNAVRAEGFPDYAVTPPGARDPYTAIVYLEPFSGRNLRAFGYDMYSESTRREAMERARDTGEPAMTHRVTLVQETSSDVQPGFLMYLPVYRQSTSPRTVAERRASLVGWVYSPFRARDLMAAVFGEFVTEAEVEVFDGPPNAGNLLYASPGASRTARQVLQYPIDVGGVRWTARFRSSEIFESRVNRSQPQLILLSGLLLTSLIFVVFLVSTRYRGELERQVRDRTAELEKARDEAESASRAKSAFLATVSHELRTPLNAIIGFSSLLLQDEVNAEQRKQLVIVNRSGLQLLELIKEILDITSIEAGQLHLQVVPLSLRRILEEQCELLRVQAREQGLYLRMEQCDEATVVLADRGRLGQVIRNLLSNGLKFTDRGGVTVRCRKDGRVAKVEVEDTGIGIPLEQRVTLFAPFQRAERSRSNRPGTGLGLALCRRLVEAMGGRIGFDSEVDRGSRFWFTLPLASEEVSSGRDGPE